MTVPQAVDAVISDIRDHRINPDGTGLFNVMRHTDLLCHLTARMAADAEYQHTSNIADLPFETLGTAAGHLGQAVAHYARALAPLIVLVTEPQDTLQHRLDALSHHSTLRIHLDDAAQALAAARSVLNTPPRPPASRRPTAVSSPAPAVRRRT